MADFSQLQEQFRAFIVQHCDTDPGAIVADGKWHRFNIKGTRHKSSRPGRYLLHLDGKANGLFWDWRDEKVRHHWFADGPAIKVDREEIARRRKERQDQLIAQYAKASAAALTYFQRECVPINGASHPYLERKKIAPHGSRQGSGRPFGLGDETCVIIPIRSAENKPLSLQAIRGDGERRYWKDSTKEGGYCLIGSDKSPGPVVFCEGFATGATIHEATGWLVVVCLEASNMKNVARWAGHRWHGRDMIVAGDDDTHLVAQGKPNLGRDAAVLMARNLGARVVFPDLQGADGSDFNDQAEHYGVSDVSSTFLAVLDEQPVEHVPELPPELGDEPLDLIEPDRTPIEKHKDDGDLPGQIDPADWLGKSAPDRRFIIPGWIIRGAAGLLSGQEGVGKSLLAQQMATCAAAGLPFLGLPIEKVKSMYVSCEDPLDEMWRRQEGINAALGIKMDVLAGRFRPVSLKGQLGNELATKGENGAIAPGKRFRQIRASAMEMGANLIFLDNAAHFFDGDENKRHDVAAFLGLVERLAEDIDGAVIMLAHPNKSHAQGNKAGNEFSGSTGWSAHVRNRLFLDWKDMDDTGLPLDGDMRLLRKSKANYGKKGEEIDFRWHQWAFVTTQDLGEDNAAELARTSVFRSQEKKYLLCLEKLTGQKRSVSASVNARNYAPRVMADMPEAAGMSEELFKQAQERLFSTDRIEAEAPLWISPKNRHPVFGIAAKGVRSSAL